MLMNETEPCLNCTAGTIALCYGNTYGTICDDRWDIIDAGVICRQLGYTFEGRQCSHFKSSMFFEDGVIDNSYSLCTDAVPVRGAFYGSGLGPILLDNVVCQGTESSLLDCASNPIGEHNCDHSEDAGVRCEGMLL